MEDVFSPEPHGKIAACGEILLGILVHAHMTMLLSLPSVIWKIRYALSRIEVVLTSLVVVLCIPVAFSLGGSEMLFRKGEAYGHCVKHSLAVQSSAPSVTSEVTQQNRRETKPDLPISELSLPVCTGLLQKANSAAASPAHLASFEWAALLGCMNETGNKDSIYVILILGKEQNDPAFLSASC